MPLGGTVQTGWRDLVGRDADVDALCSTLELARWQVLVGAGGVGKTSLALVVAERWSRQDGHVASFVSLGHLTEDATSTRDVNDALERAAGPDDSWNDRESHLLVVDNVEHLLDAVIASCQNLLARRPRLSLLVTSRRTITRPDVRVHEVAPLSTEGEGSPATRLFVRRARDVCPSLDLSTQMSVVGRLCEELDGVPLALELAALRLRTFSLHTLASNGPARGILGQERLVGLVHQRSMAASIAWSIRLLGEDERELLRGLAGLPRTFTMPEVMEGSTGVLSRGRPDWVSDTLAALVDASMLLVARGGVYRYRVLATDREFLCNARGAD